MVGIRGYVSDAAGKTLPLCQNIEVGWTDVGICPISRLTISRLRDEVDMAAANDPTSWQRAILPAIAGGLCDGAENIHTARARTQPET